MNKHRLGALVAAAALTLTFAGTAFAGSFDWNGKNGWPVADGCNQDDTPAGFMLWIYTGDSDSDVVLTMNGTEYTGVQKGGGSWHIITPYTDSKPDASIAFTGDYDNGVLTISHGCAGETTETTETSSTETTETSTTDTETTETSTTETSTTETSTTDTETTDTSTTATETTDTETTETTPSGSVEELTPPSTDTVATTGSSSTVSTSLLLILAGILATAMVVVPAAARSRR
jgi:hypothetical protein